MNGERRYPVPLSIYPESPVFMPERVDGGIMRYFIEMDLFPE
jgi:hypothetical protein